MWWIVLGVLLLALLVLVASLYTVAGRVRPLRRAMRRLKIRAEQAQRLERRSRNLQTSVAELQTKLEEAAGRAERLRS
jgi:predicted RNase H-like nuclease (RuvC/YqgF family)